MAAVRTKRKCHPVAALILAASAVTPSTSRPASFADSLRDPPAKFVDYNNLISLAKPRRHRSSARFPIV
jgi:hypothetical protein